MFTAGMGALTVLIIYGTLSGSSFVNSACLILAALTAAPVWSPRPQLFSFVLLAILDAWLSQRGRRALRGFWLLPLFFAIWANLHGGWIWGFLLLVAHLVALIPIGTPRAGAAWRPFGELLAWTVAAALAIAINPNGPALWRLPFHTVNVSMDIQEWASPDFHRLDLHPLLWMLLLLLLTARFAASRTGPAAALKLAGFAYLAFVSQRNIAPFAIVAAPVLAEWGDSAVTALRARLPAGPTRQPEAAIPRPARLAMNFVLLAALGLAGIGRALAASSESMVLQSFPAAAARWIASHRPEPRLYNSYNWGGYLIWALPEYPVFIDGRADLYGSELILEWREIASGSAAGLERLDQRGVNTVIIEPGWPLVDRLRAAGWRTGYQDEQSVVLLR
jgi:hypothetical protein